LNVERDGLMNTPEYFHNALMYWNHNFLFINPAFQGFFESLARE
jgi:hypothetical protein